MNFSEITLSIDPNTHERIQHALKLEHEQLHAPIDSNRWYALRDELEEVCQEIAWLVIYS